jgi:hypothetical protein
MKIYPNHIRDLRMHRLKVDDEVRELINDLTTTSPLYVATPYSHSSMSVERERFEMVSGVKSILLENGIKNYSPISETHPAVVFGDLPNNWAFWKSLDVQFLNFCSGLIVYKNTGWRESTGVQAEIKIMSEMKKPIFSLEAVNGYLELRKW